MASYVWEVRILEGRDILSRDIKAVALEVTAGRVNKKLGPFYGAPSPRFDQVVPLRFTAEEYRTLEKTGISQCKVTVLAQSSQGGPLKRLGYLVLELKEARNNGSLSTGPRPKWYKLKATVKPASQDAPSVLVAHAMRKEPGSAEALHRAGAQAAAPATGGSAPTSAGRSADNPDSAADPETERVIRDLGRLLDRGTGRVDASDQMDEESDMPSFATIAAAEVRRGVDDAQGAPATVGCPAVAVRTSSAAGARPAAGQADGRLGGDGSSPGRDPAPDSEHRGGDSGADGDGNDGVEGGAEGAGLARSIGSPGNSTALSAAGDAARERKRFRLGIELRSFRPGPRLPLTVARVYATAQLPAALAPMLGRRAGQPMHAMRTAHVDAPRGIEVPLSKGFSEVQFSALVGDVFDVLKDDPKLALEVWHKEKDRADTLIGSAEVSMAPLLQESWVDGYAPLFATIYEADGLTHERVQVGRLRVILLLEDVGPAAESEAPAPVSREGAWAANEMVSAGDRGSEGAPATGQSARGEHTGATAGAAREGPQPGAAAEALLPVGPSGRAGREAPKPRGARGDSRGAVDASAETAAEVRARLEREVAYELDLWRRSQEAMFAVELREKELARMQALEDEWRRRERAREAEQSQLRGQQRALETRARELLAAVEERERRVVAAEEALARRRQQMEREHASRLQEAESAVRRLQVEFEHQIELERSRNMEVVRQRQAAEARATSLEQRCAAIEQAFIDFRARQRSTPEAEMQAQLSEALAARHAAEERAGRLARAKRHYKEQVVRLAKDLAALQAESLKERERWLAKERRTLDTVAFARAAQEQLRLTQDAQKELREIRGRLAAMAGEPGGEAAAAGADADGAEGEQVRNPRERGGRGLDAAAAAGEAEEGRSHAGGQGQDLAEIRRLLAEKAELLATGIYSREDPVIVELDAQVQSLMKT